MMEWPPPPLKPHLEVDGVRYKLPEWLEVGCSIFLPCLNHPKMYANVAAYYAIRKFQFTYEVTTEKNLLGIRVWRVA